MAIGTVSFVALNMSKTFKNGKTYEGTDFSFITEAGIKKKEFVFANAPFTKVLETLSAGDKIEATYVKNGDYFNLTDVKLIEKGNGVAGSKLGNSTGGTPKGSGGFGESPEKQASIQRQNALTNALSMIHLLFEQECYKKKTSPDIILNETLRFAKAFAAFNSGELQTEEIKAKSPVEEVPFDMVEGDEFGA
jgi:hypothetical protein